VPSITTVTRKELYLSKLGKKTSQTEKISPIKKTKPNITRKMLCSQKFKFRMSAHITRMFNLHKLFKHKNMALTLGPLFSKYPSILKSLVSSIFNFKDKSKLKKNNVAFQPNLNKQETSSNANCKNDKGGLML